MLQYVLRVIEFFGALPKSSEATITTEGYPVNLLSRSASAACSGV